MAHFNFFDGERTRDHVVRRSLTEHGCFAVEGDPCCCEFGGGCTPDLVCDGTCKKPLPPGSACEAGFVAAPYQCQEGEVCVGDESSAFCRRPLDRGAACDPALARTGAGCPGSMECDAIDKVCRPIIPWRGEPCTGPCFGNNYCHPDSKTCVAMIALGKACVPAVAPAKDPCFDSTCDLSTQRCAAMCAT